MTARPTPAEETRAALVKLVNDLTLPGVAYDFKAQATNALATMYLGDRIAELTGRLHAISENPHRGLGYAPRSER